MKVNRDHKKLVHQTKTVTKNVQDRRLTEPPFFYFILGLRIRAHFLSVCSNWSLPLEAEYNRGIATGKSWREIGAALGQIAKSWERGR
jgi:hypothetical protein